MGNETLRSQIAVGSTRRSLHLDNEVAVAGDERHALGPAGCNIHHRQGLDERARATISTSQKPACLNK
jgi:hypothetical protein